MSKRSKAVQQARSKRRTQPNALPHAPLPKAGLCLLRPDGNEVLLGSLFDQVYSMQDEDETQYHWSVTEATRRALFGATYVDFSLSEAGITVDVVRRLYTGMDEAHALTRDLSRPLLFVPFKGSHQLIDGWHRLFRAATEGVDILPALLLSQQDADASLVIKLPPGNGIDWGQNGPAPVAS